MSLLQMNMFNNQMDSFRPGHLRSRSYAELLNSLKQSGANKSEAATTGGANDPQKSTYVKKRSYSDLVNETPSLQEALILYTKRSRTAPPSPPSPSESLQKSSNLSEHARRDIKYRAKSLSPNKRFGSIKSSTTSSKTSPFVSPGRSADNEIPDQYSTSVKLPSITTALNSAPITSSAPIKLKPIMPTVSLDYFDTYKPNDENWRYGVLDTINRGSKNFNLNQYNYLNKHASKPSALETGLKPSFDSRISSKIAKPTLIPKIRQHERKINFPYESNYTYLNKTYMNDVARYPEYLELAHSLIQLSQPQPPSPTHVSHRRKSDDTSYSSVGVSMSSTFGTQQYSPPHSAHYSMAPTNNATAHHNYNSIEASTHQARSVSPKSESSRRSSYTTPKSQTKTKFIPISPPSSKSKTKMDTMRSVQKSVNVSRVCISCGSDQSPCWRPSWSIKEGQLCNSCGLRYKKTSARCLNQECRKIPAKGEWSLMQSKGKTSFSDGHTGYSCLSCNGRVEVKR